MVNIKSYRALIKHNFKKRLLKENINVDQIDFYIKNANEIIDNLSINKLKEKGLIHNLYKKISNNIFYGSGKRTLDEMLEDEINSPNLGEEPPINPLTESELIQPPSSILVSTNASQPAPKNKEIAEQPNQQRFYHRFIKRQRVKSIPSKAPHLEQKRDVSTYVTGSQLPIKKNVNINELTEAFENLDIKTVKNYQQKMRIDSKINDIKKIQNDSNDATIENKRRLNNQKILNKKLKEKEKQKVKMEDIENEIKLQEESNTRMDEQKQQFDQFVIDETLKASKRKKERIEKDKIENTNDVVNVLKYVLDKMIIEDKMSRRTLSDPTTQLEPQQQSSSSSTQLEPQQQSSSSSSTQLEPRQQSSTQDVLETFMNLKKKFGR